MVEWRQQQQHWLILNKGSLNTHSAERMLCPCGAPGCAVDVTMTQTWLLPWRDFHLAKISQPHHDLSRPKKCDLPLENWRKHWESSEGGACLGSNNSIYTITLFVYIYLPLLKITISFQSVFSHVLILFCLTCEAGRVIKTVFQMSKVQQECFKRPA